jgi:hypothetical protein
MSFNYEQWKQQQFNAPGVGPGRGEDMPTAAFWAGVIWVVAGMVYVLGAVLLSLRVGNFSPAFGLLLWAAVHLAGGVRTLNGTAPGTVRNGILSVVFGLIWVCVAVVGGQTGTNPDAPLLALGLGAFGVALLAAGGLAFSCSGDYKRWRGRQSRRMYG